MLIRYNPLRQWVRREDLAPAMWNRPDDFFGNFLNKVNDLNLEAPKIEVKENEKNYLIRGEFPGFDKDEIKAEVVDDRLTLRAEHKEEKWDQNEDEGWRSIETQQGAFTRSFILPEDVAIDKVKAKMKDGVLRITLPREPKNEKKAKEIAVH